MTPQEAKRVLLACRAGPDDRDDPDVKAALALVGRDEELAVWWRQQQQAHARLVATFRELPVPPGLKEEILARRKLVVLPWWRTTRARVAAVAALLVGVLALVLWPPRGNMETFADYRDRMVRTVVREYRMDINTAVETEVREFLRTHQGHADYQLPAGLNGVPLFGAGRLAWKGQPVSMICFERQTGSLMYLFVIDRAAFAIAPGLSPEFAEVVRRPTASWTSGDRTYLLVTDPAAGDLNPFVD
jgi:hypothetical protein